MVLAHDRTVLSTEKEGCTSTCYSTRNLGNMLATCCVLYDPVDAKCPEQADLQTESGLVAAWGWGRRLGNDC